nr:hypothetical protein [Serratia symbiotica]
MACRLCRPKSSRGEPAPYRGQHTVEEYDSYHRRSIAETAMYRVKQLFGGHLALRDYDAQVPEAMAMICALNKMTLAGMPESVRVA